MLKESVRCEKYHTYSMYIITFFGKNNHIKIYMEGMIILKKVFIFMISIVLILSGYLYYINYEGDSIEVLSRYGSSGEEVRQIQQKLKNWGYYNDSIDGVYGSKTLSAVKKFQKSNGLKEDGIAGEKTLAAMGINSSSGSRKHWKSEFI